MFFALTKTHYPIRVIAMIDYSHRISSDPARRGGKPCIREMRITVYDVLEYLAGGMSEAEILRDFPYLTADDIRACLQYAADREHHQMAVFA
jgi:uncharacterized protein (DUF433 family)